MIFATFIRTLRIRVDWRLNYFLIQRYFNKPNVRVHQPECYRSSGHSQDLWSSTSTDEAIGSQYYRIYIITFIVSGTFVYTWCLPLGRNSEKEMKKFTYTFLLYLPIIKRRNVINSSPHILATRLGGMLRVASLYHACVFPCMCEFLCVYILIHIRGDVE